MQVTELFKTLPHGIDKFKLNETAFSMFRRLGRLQYMRLVSDAFIIPEFDEDSSAPLPVAYDFRDGIYLCTGQYQTVGKDAPDILDTEDAREYR